MDQSTTHSTGLHPHRRDKPQRIYLALLTHRTIIIGYQSSPSPRNNFPSRTSRLPGYRHQDNNIDCREQLTASGINFNHREQPQSLPFELLRSNQYRLPGTFHQYQSHFITGVVSSFLHHLIRLSGIATYHQYYHLPPSPVTINSFRSSNHVILLHPISTTPRCIHLPSTGITNHYSIQSVPITNHHVTTSPGEHTTGYLLLTCNPITGQHLTVTICLEPITWNLSAPQLTEN